MPNTHPFPHGTDGEMIAGEYSSLVAFLSVSYYLSISLSAFLYTSLFLHRTIYPFCSHSHTHSLSLSFSLKFSLSHNGRPPLVRPLSLPFPPVCIINPRRACAARVTVVVLCVCLCVCVCVCVSRPLICDSRN